MAPEEIAKLVSNNPTLLTLLTILLIAGYALKILAQASETASKYIPVLGKHWREQGNKAARRAAAQQQQEEARRNTEHAENADLRSQLAHFKKRLDEVERNSELTNDYLVYDAEWHASNEIHAAEHGHTFLPPKHLTYNEFRRQAPTG